MATRQPFEPESAQSAEFFRKLASGVPGILFTYLLSADGSSHYYPYVSDQVRTLFGVEPETLKESADAVFSVIHPDDAADVGDSILESARTLKPWKYRARLKLNSGDYQWFEVHSMPERQSDGSTLWYGQFHNIQHYKELEQELRESEAEFSFQAGFQKLVARLSTDFINPGIGSLDECVDRLLGRVGRFFGTDRAYLYGFDDNYTSITRTHLWCADGAEPQGNDQDTVCLDADESWQQKILGMRNSNQAIFIDDIPNSHVASAFCVPVRVRGQVVGFLGLDSLHDREWRLDQPDLLIIISGLLSGALERHLLEEELLNQSIRDPMTGLHNRRYLMPRLEELVERAVRHGENFTIAMFDFDHFKHINDSVGHLGGDYVLQRFADILRYEIRATDVVARFGGEEFMVVFTDAGQREAERMVGRILNAVRHAGLTFDDHPIPATVSAGIADSHESKQPPASPDVLIGRADHRLYLAKQAGRDCAVGASGILRI